MSYLQFLFIFLLPPICVLAFLQTSRGSRATRGVYLRIGIIAAIALVYTTPWDNYLIAIGAWRYSPDVVVGTIGLVPVEEYCFFILQPFATGLLFDVMRSGRSLPVSDSRGISPGGVLAGLGLAVAGAVALVSQFSIYLGLILVWSGPVIALQWFFNGDILRRMAKTWIAPLAISTVYLWIADAIAIRLGIWSISDAATVGWQILGLPVEEMTFFLLTNAMVVFGLVLLDGSSLGRWVEDKR
ncbi:MAG: lycopene cyclase domain-containing protein [Rhodothermales bacterium]